MTKISESAQDSKREQPLQAVLLADSFEGSSRPLSDDIPTVLQPLCNVAQLDYVIDFLAGARVQELYVVCTSEQVEEYLQQQQVHSQPHSMSITTIFDPSLSSAGDALREIDRRDLISSDPFILLYGDVIANCDLQQVLKQHAQRHMKDRSAIMTCIFKSVGYNALDGSQYANIKAHTDDMIVGLDPTQDNRIVTYQDDTTAKDLAIPCSFVATHAEVQLRYDLLDTGIYICSPDVIARFSDEFDYNDIRRKFVQNSVAEEEEGLQNRLYAHILKSHEYAARVTDLNTYAAISKDVLQRWCYPIVPENLPSGYEHKYRYVLSRHYVYHEKSTKVGRSTVFKGPGMMGSGCVVGENCRIAASVVGHECLVGSHVSIQNSFLQDRVIVEDSVSISYSMIGPRAVIKTGAKVGRGCVIGAGCVVGRGIVLKDYTRLTLRAPEADDFDDGFSSSGDEEESQQDGPTEPQANDGFASDKIVVGADGKGRVWSAPEDEDDENEDLYGLSTEQVLQSQSLGFDPSGVYAARRENQQDAEDDFSDDDNSMEDVEYSSAYNDVGIDFVSGESAPILGRQKGVDVVKELKAICMEFEASSPIDNLSIELNSYKFSQNAEYSDCTMAAMLSILERMNISEGTSDGKLVSEFKGLLEVWAPLLQKMSIGVDEEKAIVAAIERCAGEDSEMGHVLSSGLSFRFLLQTLHDEDILSDEAVLSWAAERKSEPEDSTRGKLFRLQAVQAFLEWIENESDESDSESGSDESE